MSKGRIVALTVVALLFGLFLGAALFSGVRPRSFLAVANCSAERCLQPNELVGLLASVGIQHAPGFVPRAYKETDKTVVVEYQPGWFVLFPKRDIKNASLFQDGDEVYLVDIYAVMGDLIRERKMTNWQIFTNGPDIQHITYLHFHLMDRSVTNAVPQF